MKLYKCKLVNNGYVKKLFFFEGASPDDVLAGLNMFEWPSGEWDITPVDSGHAMDMEFTDNE